MMKHPPLISATKVSYKISTFYFGWTLIKSEASGMRPNIGDIRVVGQLNSFPYQLLYNQISHLIKLNNIQYKMWRAKQEALTTQPSPPNGKNFSHPITLHIKSINQELPDM